MSALNKAVLQSGTNRKPSGNDRLSGLHRGEVANLAGGRAWFTLPRVTGAQVHGPYPVLPAGVAIGDRVLVGAIDGRIDDLIVMHVL